MVVVVATEKPNKWGLLAFNTTVTVVVCFIPPNLPSFLCLTIRPLCKGRASSPSLTIIVHRVYRIYILYIPCLLSTYVTKRTTPAQNNVFHIIKKPLTRKTPFDTWPFKGQMESVQFKKQTHIFSASLRGIHAVLRLKIIKWVNKNPSYHSALFLAGRAEPFQGGKNQNWLNSNFWKRKILKLTKFKLLKTGNFKIDEIQTFENGKY